MKLSHHELDVWKVAVDLVREVYKLTADFPSDERYGLVGQMRRAAVSVPSNIAEGAARGTKRELSQFLIVARGSLAELETQLRIAIDLGLVDKDRAEPTATRIERTFALLSGLLRSVGTYPTAGFSPPAAHESEPPLYATDLMDDDP